MEPTAHNPLPPRWGPARPASWVRPFAEWLDTRFRVPGTEIRFGLDPLIGLLPLGGDTVTFLAGGVMLLESYRLRLGWGTAGRIVWSLFVDWLAGLVPVLDIVLDTIVKSHLDNAELIERRAADRYPSTKRVVNEAA